MPLKRPYDWHCNKFCHYYFCWPDVNSFTLNSQIVSHFYLDRPQSLFYSYLKKFHSQAGLATFTSKTNWENRDNIQYHALTILCQKYNKFRWNKFLQKQICWFHHALKLELEELLLLLATKSVYIQLLEYVIPPAAPSPKSSLRYGVSQCYGVILCYGVSPCYGVILCYGAFLRSRLKSRGPKGLQLEVGARRAPRLLVWYIFGEKEVQVYQISLCTGAI